MLDIAEMEVVELESELEHRGIARYHARQIYRWVYRHGVSDFTSMTDLAGPVREQLSTHIAVSTPRLRRKELSADGTIKFLLELGDGRLIEAVFIPDSPGQTLCISTQVGCAMGCAFCLTAKMGLVRHLTAGEIAGQVRVVASDLGLHDRRFNIVLMGMGEPLHNYDATMKALRLLSAQEGLAISPRRITLSTVGLVDALDRLAIEPLMPNLAISLHATTEAARQRLVPPSRKHGLGDIIEACRRFPLKRRARITFEYVLLSGVNDSVADAHRLVLLLRGIRSKVNLIPLNAATGIPFERPSEAQIDRFAEVLARGHLTVSVRKSRGRDIRAACGQLIVEGGAPSPAQRAAALMQGGRRPSPQQQRPSPLGRRRPS